MTIVCKNCLRCAYLAADRERFYCHHPVRPAPRGWWSGLGDKALILSVPHLRPRRSNC